MKRKLWIMGVIVLTVSLALGIQAGADPPPLEEQIEASIAKGLTWLAAQQNDDGSWGQSCDRVPRTGLAVLKFATRAIEFRLDPLSDEYEYSAQVVNGLDYLLTQSHVQAIGIQHRHQIRGGPQPLKRYKNSVNAEKNHEQQPKFNGC